MTGRLQDIFDRDGRVPRPAYHRLLAELRSFVFYRPASPDPALFPPGGRHIVLVIPAFLTTDFTTKPLRRFLDRCGYRVFGWRLGVNWGPTAARRLALRARLEALAEREGGPISLVGVSLGGLLARDLAYDRPQAVRQVITLASPFRLPTASTLEPLFKLMAPFYDTDLDVARLRRPLPVPAMALYTREDGIVAWQSCVGDEPGDGAADVGGAHVTICRNPKALALVARRLAAAPGAPLPARSA